MTVTTTAPPSSRPVEERGTTTLADRVVEKIAAQAATEVDHAEGVRRRVVGQEVGRAAARADARIDGHLAVLTVRVGVEFPAPVGRVAAEVRRRVAESVTRLCDLQVDHVDVQVAALTTHKDQSRRVI